MSDKGTENPVINPDALPLKIFHRDGGEQTIGREDIAQIAKHCEGKTLSQIAAEPPAFAHLLNGMVRVVDLVRQYQRAAECVEVLEAERVGAQGDDMGGQLRAAALRGVAEIAIQLRNIKLPPEQKPRSLGVVFGKTGDDLKRVRRG